MAIQFAPHIEKLVSNDETQAISGGRNVFTSLGEIEFTVPEGHYRINSMLRITTARANALIESCIIDGDAVLSDTIKKHSISASLIRKLQSSVTVKSDGTLRISLGVRADADIDVVGFTAAFSKILESED